jgi:hypothetical protein
MVQNGPARNRVKSRTLMWERGMNLLYVFGVFLKNGTDLSRRKKAPLFFLDKRRDEF